MIRSYRFSSRIACYNSFLRCSFKGVLHSYAFDSVGSFFVPIQPQLLKKRVPEFSIELLAHFGCYNTLLDVVYFLQVPSRKDTRAVSWPRRQYAECTTTISKVMFRKCLDSKPVIVRRYNWGKMSSYSCSTSCANFDHRCTYPGF
jgi:hypothetical protein